MNDEPVEIPIEDTLDLHTFLPKEVPILIPEYIEVCREKGFEEVRIIHGKGTGVLRERVHSILRKLTGKTVVSFELADRSGGDWGSTVVKLMPPDPPE